MEKNLIVVFDTETTGLPLHPDAPLEKQPKIIELGAALLDETGAVVDTFQQLLHPGEDITEEITKITGITNEQLKDQPKFVDVLPQLRDFAFERCVVRGIAVGRGARTDEPADHRTAQGSGDQPDREGGECVGHWCLPEGLCTGWRLIRRSPRM